MAATSRTHPTRPASGGAARRSPRRLRPGRVILVLVLAAVGAVMVFPALWVFTTAFAPSNEIATGALIPAELSLYNLQHLLATAGAQDPIIRWLINSIAVSGITAIIVAIIDSLAAFALARLTFTGRTAAFYAITSSLVIPFPIATLLPLYLEFEKLGLLDTYGALILPYTANAFGIFLLYQFFKGIPQELQDAAVADGASRFRIWRAIFLPLSLPVTVTLGLITFMNVYNDFFWPLVATSSPDMRTITVGIEIVAVGQYSTNYTALMALTVLSVIPMLIAFIFAQRRLVEGISFAGFQG
jgi:multiple sugar transport system permease protein